MSSVRLTFEGINELRAGLQKLPQELTEKAARVVQATARQVGQEVQLNYPRGRTGNLKAGVRVSIEGSTSVSAKGIVRSAAPHAHLYENGTSRRQTNSGANRGRMPQGPTESRVGPRASRARRRMYEQLIEIVQEAGLTVTVT